MQSSTNDSCNKFNLSKNPFAVLAELNPFEFTCLPPSSTSLSTSSRNVMDTQSPTLALEDIKSTPNIYSLGPHHTNKDTKINSQLFRLLAS